MLMTRIYFWLMDSKRAGTSC